MNNCSAEPENSKKKSHNQCHVKRILSDLSIVTVTRDDSPY